MLVDGDRLALGRHGWIADTASGADIAADGTIDWYCPGRFDRDPVFTRLVDPAEGAAVRVGPAGAARSVKRSRLGDQRYEPGTNVLRTTLPGRDSLVEVTDFLPWAGGDDQPPGRVVRIVRALRGPATIEVEVVAPTAGGRPVPTWSWSEGIAFGHLQVRTGFRLEPVPLDRSRVLWRGTCTLDAGQRLVVSVDDLDSDRHRPLSVDDAMRLLADTSWAWTSWGAGIGYDGPYRPAVERAALAVKGLTWYRSGAPVAAGTAGLPRSVGGERNDDRRWVRWRDAAVAAVVLPDAGLVEDGEAAARWLRAAVAEGVFPLRGVADVEGGPPADPEELRLAGWRRSQPVRLGVGDTGLQLDVCGELIAAVRPGGPLTGDWPKLVALTDWLADHWAEADAGAWELARPAQFVASKLQCWYGLDRMARVARARHPLDLDAAGWQQTAGDILAWIDKEGHAGPGRGLRRDTSSADAVDASLLRAAWRAPWPADHPLVVQTVERVLGELSEGGLIRRYPAELDDGLPGADSPDLTASLWAVKALACLDRWEEAHERMETVCALGGSLGVLAEAADPVAGELLGNLPSTSVHLALIDAALALRRGPS